MRSGMVQLLRTLALWTVVKSFPLLLLGVQISELKRPITMEDGGPVLMDLLWSDPTTNDSVQGVQPSPRGPGLVTFGPDRVKEFCKVRSRTAGAIAA